jgi:hypothetical protein
MHLAAVIFFWTLGILFFGGLAGCVIVIILTSIEDAKELFKPEEELPKIIGDPNTLSDSMPLRSF